MNNPFYYAVVWRGEGDVLIGEILDIERYQDRIYQGYRLHSFTGRKATVCVLDNDRTIERIHKLDFATMFMRGAYVTISVNLRDLTSTTTAGSPPP